MSSLLHRSALASLLALCSLAVAPAPQAQDRVVSIYSYRQPALMQPLLDRFTAETGIRTEVVHAPSGLVERLELEGPATPADVVLTVGIDTLEAMKAKGLTQPIPDQALQGVPATLIDPDRQWTALTLRARVLAVSAERVPEADRPKTWAEVADPKFKGRLCTRPGNHPYNLALIAAVIRQQGAEAAKAWVEGLKANLARRPQGNDTDQMRAVAEGVCDLAILNSYYVGGAKRDPERRAMTESLAIVTPEVTAGQGTHVNISGGVITRHAPHPAEAAALIGFLTSETAQQIYASDNTEYPVRPGVALAPELEGVLAELRPDPQPLAEIAASVPEAQRLIDETGYND